MRTLGTLALLCLASATALPSQDRIPLDEYASRRAALRNSLTDGVTILFGRTERERGETRSSFYQEPNFYYLTGWEEPNAILVLSPQREIFFVPRRNPEREKWTGRKAAAEDSDIGRRTGFENVEAAETFESRLAAISADAARIYTLSESPWTEKLQSMLPLREIADAAPAIARLRMTKSKAELAVMEFAIRVTMDAHRASWKRMSPGLHEYQIGATMTAVFQENGCQRPAYALIIGSGANGAVLHYSRNTRRMDGGELVVIDVGAECAAYAADITRTIPVSGRFTERQKELYAIVLGAQKAVIAATKPGMTLARTGPNSLYRIAYEYLDSHGKDLQGQSLGRYFTHGIGHHIGLAVHDANDPALPLAAGMVITVEPGLYIPEEGIGIRIEDMLLVTEDGAKVLTAGLPKEIPEIEGAMTGGK